MKQCIEAPVSAKRLYDDKVVRSQATALAVLDSIRKVMAKVPPRPLYGAVAIDVVPVDRLVRTKPAKATLPSVVVAVCHSNKRARFVALQLTPSNAVPPSIKELVVRRLAENSTLEIVSEYGGIDFGNRLWRVTTVSPGAGGGPIPVCDTVIGELRSWLMNVHRRPIAPAQLVPYLHECEFRFNECRSDEGKRKAFGKLIAAAVPPFGREDYRDLAYPGEVRI